MTAGEREGTRTHHRATQPRHARLGHLLPPLRGQGGLRGAGRVDTSTFARHSMAAMEDPPHPAQEAPGAGPDPEAGPVGRLWQTWTVANCHASNHARLPLERCSLEHGSRESLGRVSATCVRFVNRRLPTGMSGGVEAGDRQRSPATRSDRVNLAQVRAGGGERQCVANLCTLPQHDGDGGDSGGTQMNRGANAPITNQVWASPRDQPTLLGGQDHPTLPSSYTSPSARVHRMYGNDAESR